MSKSMLVVGLDRSMQAHEVERLREQWAEHCPGIELRLIAGATSMVLIPGVEEETA
jgi:hypothetical protein